MKLGFEIQKTNVGIGISILEIPCVLILRQNGQLWIFWPKFAQKSILGQNFKILSLDSESASLRCYVHHFSDKTNNFRFFGPKFAQKWIMMLEFQKSKSGFGIRTSNILFVPIFSQNGQLLIFWSKFGEIAQLRAIFWFKYCWGCCRELSGDWNELGGGGWSCVEVGARFSNTPLKNSKFLFWFLLFQT